MAAAAAEHADLVVLTSDNPRSEDPQRILRDAEAGFAAGTAWQTIADRQAAIVAAVGLAQDGDCVVIAGKGHETVQLLGDKRLPFDDRLVAREALQQRGCA